MPVLTSWAEEQGKLNIHPYGQTKYTDNNTYSSTSLPAAYKDLFPVDQADTRPWNVVMTERHTMIKMAAAGKTWNQIMTERDAQRALVAKKQKTRSSVDDSIINNIAEKPCRNCNAFASSHKSQIW